MLLKEMFSAIGAPKDDLSDINWIEDLKFYIDNNDGILTQHIFPAVFRHKNYIGHPNVYKIYIRPLKHIVVQYCNQYDIKDPEKKFDEDSLVELAKKIAQEQELYIKNGDYEN